MVGTGAQRRYFGWQRSLMTDAQNLVGCHLALRASEAFSKSGPGFR